MRNKDTDVIVVESDLLAILSTYRLHVDVAVFDLIEIKT